MAFKSLVWCCTWRAGLAAAAAVLWLVCASLAMGQAREWREKHGIKNPPPPVAAAAAEAATPGQLDDARHLALERRVDELIRLVEKYRDERPTTTWEDWGAKADDRDHDNGPPLSRMLAAGVGCRAGTRGRYFTRTPIVQPSKSAGGLWGVGGTSSNEQVPVTRIVGLGPPEQPVIILGGSGASLGEMLVTSRTGAHEIIKVLDDNQPNTGNHYTRQLSLSGGVRGWSVEGPRNVYAAKATHVEFGTHDVEFPYWIDGDQSVMHTFVAATFRTGYKQAITFVRGGPLLVSGCHLGKSDGGVLLALGNTDSGTGSFEINGLQVDGSASGVVLVAHKRLCHRVRIRGGAASGRGTLAAEPIRNLDAELLAQDPRKPKYVDIEIDMLGCQATSKFPE